MPRKAVPRAIQIRNSQNVKITGNSLSDTSPESAPIAIDASCDVTTIQARANQGFRVVPRQ